MKNSYKISSILALCLSAKVAVAHNWLVGIEGGHASRSGTLSTQYSLAPGIIPIFSGIFATHNQHISDNDFVYGMLGGYQWLWDSAWLLGIEANVNWGNSGSDHQYIYSNFDGSEILASTAEYDRGTTYGLSARLGYAFKFDRWPCALTPYVRVGGQYSSDELSVNSALIPDNISDGSFSEDKNIFAWVVGAGIELPLINDFTLRAEYNYARSERMTLNDSIIPLTGIHEIKPKTQTVKLAVVWNFI